MAYCLPKNLADEVLRRVKSGEISPGNLMDMTSDERRKYFAEFLGEENAKNTNALFERKLLLKNKQRGLITWVKTVSGLKPEIRRDLISRIERMDERILNPAEEDQFLEDLAERSLGFGVTEAEAQEIFELSQKVYESRDAVDRNSPDSSDSRLQYGKDLVNFKNKIEEHKRIAAKQTIREKGITGVAFDIASSAKSALASFDNSFFGRQGLKVLFNNPTTWAKTFMKSWGDMGRAVVDGDAIDLIKADIYSRENAMNGTYQRMGLDIGIGNEEEFPSALPEKIPLLGRLFRASEVAFNGGAMRMRALYADQVLKVAEKNGVDLTDKEVIRDYGRLVNSMTGRGDIGRLGAVGREVNVLLFSVRFLKANIETLTMPLNANISPSVRKQAAVNLMRIIAGIAAVLATAKAIDPDSVELDPRSPDFGKIVAGNTRFDVTGGMGSLITLASRIMPSYHDGKISFWTKSASGNYTDLTAGEYGQRNAMDVFWGFWENKASPAVGVVRDVWKGETFDFQKPTLASEIKNLTVPIPVQTFNDLMTTEGAPVLAGMIAETLGIGVNVYKD